MGTMKPAIAFIAGLFIPFITSAAYAQAAGGINVVPVTTLTIISGFALTIATICGVHFRAIGRIEQVEKIVVRIELRDMYHEAEMAELRHNTAKVFQTVAIPGCTWEMFKTLRWKDEPKPPRV